LRAAAAVFCSFAAAGRAAKWRNEMLKSMPAGSPRAAMAPDRTPPAFFWRASHAPGAAMFDAVACKFTVLNKPGRRRPGASHAFREGRDARARRGADAWPDTAPPARVMTGRPIRAFLFAGLMALAPALAPSLAWAQAQPSLSPEDQIAPRQVQTAPSAQPAPRAKRTPRSIPPPAANPDPDPAANPAAAPAAPKPAPAARAVACSGAFAKDSNHLKLVQVFEAKNVTYGPVAGAQGSTLNASVLYPKDPKRRLEVLWQNEAARSDTSMIVITGQSQWHGPKGLRLGLALAALEKINGKPFKLSGFDQADGSAVLDWQDGTLALLPGGCVVGIKLAPDRKASPDVLAAAAGKELLSSDAPLRAAKPVVAEIILGYPQ
jgi:hypothetical protein